MTQDNCQSYSTRPCILVLELECMARPVSYFGDQFESIARVTAAECANLARGGKGELIVVKFDAQFDEALAECLVWLGNPTTAAIPCVLWGADFREGERVEALRSGVSEVFSGRQLSNESLVRIGNLLKRKAGGYRTGRLLRLGDIELHLDAYRVRVGTHTLRLTPQQTAVLQVLMESPGTVVSFQELTERIWSGTVDLGTVRRSVSSLASSLALGKDLSPIRNLRGVGYIFDNDFKGSAL